MAAHFAHSFANLPARGVLRMFDHSERVWFEPVVHAPCNISGPVRRAVRPPADEQAERRVEADFAHIGTARKQVEQSLGDAANRRVTDIKRTHHGFFNKLSMYLRAACSTCASASSSVAK